MLVWDIETDGLIEDVEVVHCINLVDRKTGRRLAFNGGVYRDGTPAPRDGDIEQGLRMLECADELGGHNIINYDIPVLKKLYPWWNPQGRIRDSRVEAQVIWPEVKEWDFKAIDKGSLPWEFQKEGLIGKHGLEAWGFRLGNFKGFFKPENFTQDDGTPCTWKTIGFTKEMDDYGRQDPEVTLTLFEKIDSKKYAAECLELEHDVAWAVSRQIHRGFCVSLDRMQALVATLQRRKAEIAAELGKVFQPWFAPDVVKGTALFTPKSGNKLNNYTAGCQLTKVKLVVFNPDSRDHIADRLCRVRSWKPSQYTDGGKPQVDETTLSALPWPEAKLSNEYLTIAKRLGQISDGEQAWLGHARKDEHGHYRIHGNVTTNGAVTGRMTHASPNVAQTPSVGAPYGSECRDCWIATPGLKLVGIDAEGLELRGLGHFMAPYDAGEFANAVVNGRKEDETDVHSRNRKGARLNKRDSAKTFIYALIYGAQGEKLGSIVYDDFTDEQRTRFNAKYPPSKKKARRAALRHLGDARKASLMESMPALQNLIDAVAHAVKTKGFLRGLDGRLLHIRSPHAALNTLLQSAGAVVMKKALVLFEATVAAPLRAKGATVEYVANIHDEFQIETEDTNAEFVGKSAAECITRAGEHFKFRCPLAGAYGVGDSWKDTH